MDNVLSLLAVGVGLLAIWWLCGPVPEQSRPAREGRDQSGGDDAHADAQDR
jgi:hypothetical protein